MKNESTEKTEEPDPNESPFRLPRVSGMRYKKGSEEDLAIKRLAREYEEAREAERRAAEEAAR